MNKTLFMGTLKANYAYIIGFSAFTLIYVVVSIVMFEPQSTEIIDAMLMMLPEEMIKAFGFDKLTGELTSYLAGYLFGFILLVFPMIYSILIANNLVAKLVDRGSMAYLLTSTNTRVKVLITQYVYLALSLLTIFVVDYLVALVLAEISFPGNLDQVAYFQLNVLTYFASLFVASLAFLLSCVFNESRISGLIAGGIGGVFVIARMISGLNENTEVFKYFTIYSLIDTTKALVDPGFVYGTSAILLLVSIGISGIGIWIFNKRSLAI